MSSRGADAEAEERCLVCGGGLSSEAPHCSVGCSLAARVPLGEEDLPASWELAGFLVSGFLLFNQALLGVASLVKGRQEELSASEGFATGSVVVGAVWLALALYSWAVSAPKRSWDVWVGLAGVGAFVVPVFVSGFEVPFVVRFLIANSLVAIWLYRGVYYLWLASKKREK